MLSPKVIVVKEGYDAYDFGLKEQWRYLSIDRHQCVIIHSRPVVTLNGADLSRAQQLEDRVVFAVLQEVHGVPCHRIVYCEHKVHHVLLQTKRRMGL